MNFRSREEINNSIKRIGETMIPITMTSLADFYTNIIYDKGNSKEGQIMSFKDANAKYRQRYGVDMDREYYNELFQDLRDDFDEQLTVRGALKYARSRIEKRYEEFEQFGLDIDKLDKIDTKTLLKAITEVGRKTDEEMRNGNGHSDNFYSFLAEELGLELEEY